MSVSRETLARLQRLASRWELPPDAPAKLSALLELLATDPMAPTSVTEPAQAVDVHVADSLTGLKAPGMRVAGSAADIGSGAGFPGLVLAATLPGTVFHLVESSGKKCAFLERAIASTGVANAAVVCERAEDWGRGEGRGRYDAVTARAVDLLPTLVEYAAPLLRPGGALVAWKGRRGEDEEARASRAAKALGMLPARVMGVKPFPGSRQRHLHVYEKVEPTPPGFPRRPGMARKRPLG